SAFLERPASTLNLIIAHLGSGASLCAIRAGKSLDTSMGLTPLEGLPGSTRSGSVDPALSHHLKPDPARHGSTAGTDLSEQGRVTVLGSEGVQIDWAEWELNSKSGWLALAGTRDFEEIVARKDGRVEGCTDEERRKAILAFDVFVDRVLAYLGAYTFKILATGAQHVDALVFSGGIGEHSTELRMALAAKLEHTPLALRSADGGFYGSEKVGGVRRILGPPREGGTKWSGEAAPSSPLGPGPSPSTPGSPLTLHGTTCGRWGVPWLVAETDEEMKCVRLSMPKIRNLWSSSLEHEQKGKQCRARVLRQTSFFQQTAFLCLLFHAASKNVPHQRINLAPKRKRNSHRHLSTISRPLLSGLENRLDPLVSSLL
ncbi:unnamed protein product, partial [Tilletia laevis]